LTKNELVAIVDRIYLSWNQQVNPVSQKAMYEAWWRILADLDKSTVESALDDLVIENGYMPRPGEVRRRAISLIHDTTVPSHGEAWQQFRAAADAAHSGSFSKESVHELVARTVKALGGVNAYSPHTNGDRDLFLASYDKVVKDFEREMFGLPHSQ